jgi:putative transposase
MDITYIPMARGNIYLAAVIYWYSRKILSWRVSITLDVQFCLDAVQEAADQYGAPEIFNTNQGSQFTRLAYTELLKVNGIRISMDGKGCWRDNVFVERLWRTINYEEVNLRAYDSVLHARAHWAAIWTSTTPAGLTRALTAYTRQRLLQTTPAIDAGIIRQGIHF